MHAEKVVEVLCRMLGIETLMLPAVNVGKVAREFVCAECGGRCEKRLGKMVPLWGITLRATGDLVDVMGGYRVDRPRYVVRNRALALVVSVVHALGRVWTRLRQGRKKR